MRAGLARQAHRGSSRYPFGQYRSAPKLWAVCRLYHLLSVPVKHSVEICQGWSHNPPIAPFLSSPAPLPPDCPQPSPAHSRCSPQPVPAECRTRLSDLQHARLAEHSEQRLEPVEERAAQRRELGREEGQRGYPCGQQHPLHKTKLGQPSAGLHAQCRVAEGLQTGASRVAEAPWDATFRPRATSPSSP